ncbi:hypothetical protein DFH08DRAFT_1054345 [Mycena albidolilacea]|uniref:Uncharacterized protein n=1 Tax=Mycena albidolilacea TaxID=1033008 RepID=A0AAD6Z4A5_9AGAR|nr:hypothetical protein DFH08DRAFT_1054345 [Mycena albidolilacea]
MSPEQFHGHSSPLAAPETITDASVDVVNSTRKRASSDADETSPPAKRGRGRPRKTANADVPAKPKASAPPAKPKAKTKTKAAKKDKSNEENLPPAIDIVDSDDELEKNEEGKPRYWTAEEKTCVFEFFLGLDADAERRFNQHKVNPGHVYKRASELFDGARSADSIKSLYARSLETFTWMRAFNNFTGNGGGDPDSDDPEGILKGKIAAARGSGVHVGALKPATITEWEKNGWYELFNNRLGASAKIARPIARSSASAISDLDDDDDHDNSSSDANIDPELRKAALRVPKTPAAIVSEPKHTPSSAFRKQINSSFSGLGDFMKVKMVAEEKKATMLDAKLALDRERLEMDKAKGKIDMAEGFSPCRVRARKSRSV